MPPYSQAELDNIVADYKAVKAGYSALNGSHMSDADPNAAAVSAAITATQAMIDYYSGLAPAAN